jgi:hypothetical protein
MSVIVLRYSLYNLKNLERGRYLTVRHACDPEQTFPKLLFRHGRREPGLYRAGSLNGSSVHGLERQRWSGMRRGGRTEKPC